MICPTSKSCDRVAIGECGNTSVRYRTSLWRNVGLLDGPYTAWRLRPSIGLNVRGCGVESASLRQCSAVKLLGGWAN